MYYRNKLSSNWTIKAYLRIYKEILHLHSYKRCEWQELPALVPDSCYLPSPAFRCFSKIAKKKSILALSCPSVRPSAWNNSVPLDGFSWNLTFDDFSKICRQNSSFIKNLIRILHEDQFILMISRPILPRMRNVSEEIFRENQHKFYIQ
jgi:hypothetical protein